MAASPTGRRPYSSPRREQQALETRETILDAALDQFTTAGYSPTTMEQIASAAGVSVKTVYLVFGSKNGVLRGVWDRALKGDVQPSGVAERAWYRQVLDEPDPRTKIAQLARESVRVKQRISPVLRLIRSAAETDDDLRSLWELIQSDFHANQRAVVESVAALGALRPGLEVDRATDMLWTLNHPEQWHLLVVARGWSPEEFTQWLERSIVDALLAPAPAVSDPLSGARAVRGGKQPAPRAG
jgi:AcrR family transcriptional regulator